MTNMYNPILMVREFIFSSFSNKLGLMGGSEPQAQPAKVSAADVSPIKHDTQSHRFSPSGQEVVAPLAIF
jgi:hypothetical protein